MWQKVAKFKGAEYFRKALYYPCTFDSVLTKCITPGTGSAPSTIARPTSGW